MDLKKMREELGLTQKQVAQIIKIDRSAYGKMERKNSTLRVDQLARLIKSLNLSFNYYNRLIKDSILDDDK